MTEREKYNAIMEKVAIRAKTIAKTYKENFIVSIKDFNLAIDELPQEDKNILLSYEDKQDMKLMKIQTKKPNDDITNNAFLLLTQAIIESAIAENDEDFFKSEYGETVVDMYNTALTIYKQCDYNITADLLLEKMRKKTIHIKGEREDD